MPDKSLAARLTPLQAPRVHGNQFSIALSQAQSDNITQSNQEET